MKAILGVAGIDVIEIPRRKFGSGVIPATKVCELLEKKNYAVLGKYVSKPF